jgi:hypothetical protein
VLFTIIILYNKTYLNAFISFSAGFSVFFWLVLMQRQCLLNAALENKVKLIKKKLCRIKF